MLGCVTLCLQYYRDYTSGYTHPSPMPITSNTFIFKTFMSILCALKHCFKKCSSETLKFVFMSVKSGLKNTPGKFEMTQKYSLINPYIYHQLQQLLTHGCFSPSRSFFMKLSLLTVFGSKSYNFTCKYLCFSKLYFS